MMQGVVAAVVIASVLQDAEAWNLQFVDLKNTTFGKFGHLDIFGDVKYTPSIPAIPVFRSIPREELPRAVYAAAGKSRFTYAPKTQQARQRKKNEQKSVQQTVERFYRSRQEDIKQRRDRRSSQDRFRDDRGRYRGGPAQEERGVPPTEQRNTGWGYNWGAGGGIYKERPARWAAGSYEYRAPEMPSSGIEEFDENVRRWISDYRSGRIDEQGEQSRGRSRSSNQVDDYDDDYVDISLPRQEREIVAASDVAHDEQGYDPPRTMNEGYVPPSALNPRRISGMNVILFNKPFNVLSKFRDPANKGRATIGDYVKEIGGVYAAGPLDSYTEGLLVLTDDDDVQKGQTRGYWVLVQNVPNETSLDWLRDGFTLSGKWVQADVARIDPPEVWPRTPSLRLGFNMSTAWLNLETSTYESIFVPRMIRAIGHKCLRVIRYRMGTYSLGNLQPGEWDEVTKHVENLPTWQKYRQAARRTQRAELPPDEGLTSGEHVQSRVTMFGFIAGSGVIYSTWAFLKSHAPVKEEPFVVA